MKGKKKRTCLTDLDKINKETHKKESLSWVIHQYEKGCDWVRTKKKKR